eukprot:4058955-Pyramimonas_sp.AAC.1
MRAVPLAPSVELPSGANGAVGGAPYGATKRCTGWWPTHAGGAAGTFGGAPCGATKRCTGW